MGDYLMLRIVFAVCFLTVPLVAIAAEPWSTYRGNAQRTGNTDDQAGPAKPNVLWVHKSQDHFIAAPVPVGDRLYLSGLGAFNTATFYSFATDPKAEKRIAWQKTTPFLKLPTVSSPALMNGSLVFGDGMHQTDDPFLHCVRIEKGLPLWELPIKGSLTHLEGSATAAGGRVYVGGGSAGVICVDPNKLTLEGKAHDLAEIQKLIDAKWALLQRKYEEDKKKDADLAVPPSDDDLPRPAPTIVWQQAKEKWHVDAPVAVTEDRVFVASAFLDKEQVGDRALFALDIETGEIKWRADLKVNPWGGPTVSGKTVVVSGSSVGFATGNLKNAKGEIAAFDVADGAEKWRKEIKGGVLACVTAVGDLVIAPATDGKVRAYELASGELRWTYDAKAPLFAPVAVAKDTVYAGDLKGVVHAFGLADGKEKWKLDLGDDPAVKSPGMIYGGPVVQGGRLYVATCNLEGPLASKPTVVVCIGEK
jgi:outer membrane protein assembly factor BamB